MEGKAKSVRYVSGLEKDFAALCEAPSPPRFLSWGGQKILKVPNPISGHIQSVEVLQYFHAFHTQQKLSPLPPPHTVHKYLVTGGRGGGGVQPETMPLNTS
jgi:hypothetical protein